jgi:hypothetical protein
MKKTPLAIVSMFLISASALAADDAARERTLREIDEAIWNPFVRGVETFDHALYTSVRTRDSIFVDGKRLFDYDEYVEDAVRVMTPLQKSGARLKMEVRFEDRVVDEGAASERGVLRTVMTDAKGKEQIGHARFHVISRKSDEGWRIVTDYRWRTDPAADAAAFAAAKPITRAPDPVSSR